MSRFCKFGKLHVTKGNVSRSCSAGAAGMLYMDWTAKSLLVAALDSVRMKTETTAISCTRIRQI